MNAAPLGGDVAVEVELVAEDPIQHVAVAAVERAIDLLVAAHHRRDPGVDRVLERLQVDLVQGLVVDDDAVTAVVADEVLGL